MNIWSHENKFIVPSIAWMSPFVWHTQTNILLITKVNRLYGTSWSLKWPLLYTPCKGMWPPRFFSFFPPAEEASNKQNKNCLLATCNVILAAVDQIKGSLIHLLEGSCLGYCVIPIFTDWAGVGCCVNPAAKNASFLLARTVGCLKALINRQADRACSSSAHGHVKR